MCYSSAKRLGALGDNFEEVDFASQIAWADWVNFICNGPLSSMLLIYWFACMFPTEFCSSGKGENKGERKGERKGKVGTSTGTGTGTGMGKCSPKATGAVTCSFAHE